MTRVEAIRARVSHAARVRPDSAVVTDLAYLLGLVDALAETLGEIAVHEGDPALEAKQMRSAARAALARLEGVSMAGDIRLEKDDVTVEPIFDECGQCTNTLVGDSFTVAIDFRAAGMTERLGRYCEKCAEEIASRIRAGLPTPSSAEAP